MPEDHHLTFRLRQVEQGTSEFAGSLLAEHVHARARHVASEKVADAKRALGKGLLDRHISLDVSTLWSVAVCAIALLPNLAMALALDMLLFWV